MEGVQWSPLSRQKNIVSSFLEAFIFYTVYIRNLDGKVFKSLQVTPLPQLLGNLLPVSNIWTCEFQDGGYD